MNRVSNMLRDIGFSNVLRFVDVYDCSEEKFPDGPKIAYVDKQGLHINYELVSKLSRNAQRAVVIHELAHIVHRDIYSKPPEGVEEPIWRLSLEPRANLYVPKLFLKAVEKELTKLLNSPLPLGVITYEKLYIDMGWIEKDTDYYYPLPPEILSKLLQDKIDAMMSSSDSILSDDVEKSNGDGDSDSQSKGNGDSQDKDQDKGGGGENSLEDELKRSLLKEAMMKDLENIDENAAKEVRAAIMQFEKLGSPEGSSILPILPGNEQLMPNDFYRLLARLSEGYGIKKVRSFRREGRIEYYPDRIRSRTKTTAACILAVDVSGSMVCDDAVKWVNSIVKFLQYHKIVGTVLCFDTQITYESSIATFDHSKVRGGGGTNYYPVFERAAELSNNSALIIFTDFEPYKWPSSEEYDTIKKSFKDILWISRRNYRDRAAKYITSEDIFYVSD